MERFDLARYALTDPRFVKREYPGSVPFHSNIYIEDDNVLVVERKYRIGRMDPFDFGFVIRDAEMSPILNCIPNDDVKYEMLEGVFNA